MKLKHSPHSQTHFEIQDVNLLMLCKATFVFVSMQYQKPIMQKKEFTITIAVIPVFRKSETHRVAEGRLFAVCLCSNISFMQNVTETPCVVLFAAA